MINLEFTGSDRCCANVLGVSNDKVDVTCGRVFAGTVTFRAPVDRIFELNFNVPAVLIAATFSVVLFTLGPLVAITSVIASSESVESFSVASSLTLCLLCRPG